MGKYFEKLQPYMKMIQDLRFDVFVKYAKEKSMTNHKLTCQGYEIPDVDDFVIIKQAWKLLRHMDTPCPVGLRAISRILVAKPTLL